MAKATDSSKQRYHSLYRQIRWSFGIATLVVCSLFWGVIYLAENELEVISLHHWLDTEATKYLEEYQLHGEDAPLPNSNEFDTYWDIHPYPGWLKPYQSTGFYEFLLGGEDKHFIVLDHPSGQGLLYIVFKDDADDYLDTYEARLHQIVFILGGIASLAMVLYGLYLVRSISRPLQQIEQKISQMSPDKPLFTIDSAYKETREIEHTLLESKSQIAGYFQREKEFSRFASHELRTPIMVIQGSAELLEKLPDQPRAATKAIYRIQQASADMKELTEAFLLLGKATIEPQHIGLFSLEHCLRHQLDTMAPIFAKQNANFQLDVSHGAFIEAPQSFINIIMNNLIKNAFSYSVGDIDIQLSGDQLTISNRHDGNETYNAGYGCGLAIVERICERMVWAFSTEDDGQQFTTLVRFRHT
ncbi:sensor histidine kinase [Photobacterium sanctipauli]|uniref:histidine kinase n=2 Tax=Photobacterium sanctipauli TaxID=1342794 RepID=A0A2T3NQ51_9GAMM|nr:HAMP domain-containing sensor histidine kinase [Photobacterium sanctipauli]PSW18390.1 sensor histidine kinase [Photobacterium sanctipauli]